MPVNMPKIEGSRVFHVSGGRTSGYMLIKYYQPGDIALFCDTEMEHEGTYRFIDDIENNEGIKIIRLKYPGGWKELIKKEQVVPNKFKRKCTLELKIRTARRYLREIGLKNYTQFIGFRFDEKHRVLDYPDYWQTVDTEFPLFDDKIIKLDILSFWKSKSYNLDIPDILGNCDLCFLKGVDTVLKILTVEPQRADKWIDAEESDKNGHTFFKGITMRQIRDRAVNMPASDLSQLQHTYNCSCTA